MAAMRSVRILGAGAEVKADLAGSHSEDRGSADPPHTQNRHPDDRRRYIELGRGRLVQSVVRHIADDADDIEPGAVGWPRRPEAPIGARPGQDARAAASLITTINGSP